ncbi:MAG: hypothetical protein LUD46_21215 [Parabacteroides sp.]|nr:hypothetical protein [Parabacteroides sp.]
MLNPFLKLLFVAFAVIVLFALNACYRQDNKVSYSEEIRADRSNADTLSLKPIYRLPDSLLTPEEVQLKRIYLQMIHDHLVVKNNRYKLELSKDSFLQLGLNALYYDELIKSINMTNEWVKQMKIDSLSSIFLRANQELEKQLSASKPPH